MNYDSNKFRFEFNKKFEKIINELDLKIEENIHGKIIEQRRKNYEIWNNCLKNLNFDESKKIKNCKKEYNNNESLIIEENIFSELDSSKDIFYECINKIYGTKDMNVNELNNCFKDFTNLNQNIFKNFLK